MKNYLMALRDILENGDLKNPARENMPRTKEIFGQVLRYDLTKGFPLVTTRKINIKAMTAELLWFLSGSNDVRDLWKMDCHIWDEDVFRFNKEDIYLCSKEYVETIEEWRDPVWQEKLPDFCYTAGVNYSRLWRDFGGKDQIVSLINTILNYPDSRYQIVSAWDPEVYQNKRTALPSCHILFQTSVRDNMYLDLNVYQRSCDMPIGVPFNIASYALLTQIIGDITGLFPGKLTWIGGSCHIYENQVRQVEDQVIREPLRLPFIKWEASREAVRIILDVKAKKAISPEELTELIKKTFPCHFILEGYDPHPPIKYSFSSGLKEQEIERIW